jgi:hypothetical protein
MITGNDEDMEALRRVMQAETNALADDEIPEPRWNTEELQRDFEVIGFLAPLVIVRRKSDGAKGTLMFRHSNRIYFNFQTAE